MSSKANGLQNIDFLWNGPKKAKWTVVLTHGAGAGMENRFMSTFAEGLAEQGLRVGRFEFPYMLERRRSGRKRPPDREPVLRDTWLKVIESVGADRLVIGGKSMGGRIASLVADQAQVLGLVCLGYPFHPTGKPDRLRIDHLERLETPTLILQGERDPFGNWEEVASYPLSDAIEVYWLTDGDHGLKPRKNSGRTERQNWDEAIRVIANFIAGLENQ